MDLTSFTPSSALITVIFLGLAPFVAVMATSFTKIVVVLGLLRNALGVQQIPPNLVLNGLALILTLYVMYPVGSQMLERLEGVDNVGESTDTMLAAVDASKEPLRAFLIKHSSASEREFFLTTLRRMLEPDQRDSISADDFVIIIPAFTLSELTKAFQIGFLIFLPFIIIDLVIANILMAMGMMMMSPTIVSLPFKLLLFVMLDGWTKLLLAGPPVVLAAAAGILIALLQAVTQLQEQTFQFAVKFIVVILTIFVTASLMGGTLFQFSDRIFTDFVQLTNG